MKVRPPVQRQAGRPQRLLSIRSALILTLAALTGLGGAGLLYLAHTTAALIALGGLSMFAGAAQFFDWLIGE